MATPQTTPTTPAELFDHIAVELNRIRQMLNEHRKEQGDKPISHAAMMLQFHVNNALTKATEAARAEASVPEKTMSAGGENQ